MILPVELRRGATVLFALSFIIALLFAVLEQRALYELSLVSVGAWLLPSAYARALIVTRRQELREKGSGFLRLVIPVRFGRLYLDMCPEEAEELLNLLLVTVVDGEDAGEEAVKALLARARESTEKLNGVSIGEGQ
jgi:hypothetical protein